MILFILLLGLHSCDTCEISTSGGDNSIQKIFFTAAVTNAEGTAIYSINKNLTGLSQIIENGIIYSNPSNTGFFTYLSINNKNEKELYLFDLNNNSSKFITKESAIFGIFNPVLSPDASRISINAGDGKLIIYNNDNSGTFNQISSVFEDNSTCSFSPDSKLLAFIEKAGNSSFKLNVIDAINNSSIINIYQKEYPFNFETPNYFHFFSWNKTSDKLCFGINNNDSSEIYLIDLINKKENKISFNSNNIKLYGLMLSPDGNYACFTNFDGNLWVLLLKNNDYRFYKISNLPNNWTAFSPKWSDDGSKILFSIKKKDTQEIYNTLMLADITYETSVRATEINIVSNNVFKGFIK